MVARESPLLYRFLDAGSTETFRMRSRPASKKRRGTKSRDAGQQLGSERYGDLMGEPVRWGPLPWSGDLHACKRERASERKASPPAVEGYERALGGLIVVNRVERRSWPAWGERRGSGRRRAEDVWLMRCRTRSGPAATSAGSRARTPR